MLCAALLQLCMYHTHTQPVQPNVVFWCHSVPVLLQATPADVAIITAAAFIANVFESYIGAALQGKVSWLNNDIVNVLQISVAAALAVTGKFYL